MDPHGREHAADNANGEGYEASEAPVVRKPLLRPRDRAVEPPPVECVLRGDVADRRSDGVPDQRRTLSNEDRPEKQEGADAHGESLLPPSMLVSLQLRDEGLVACALREAPLFRLVRNPHGDESRKTHACRLGRAANLGFPTVGGFESDDTRDAAIDPRLHGRHCVGAARAREERHSEKPSLILGKWNMWKTVARA